MPLRRRRCRPHAPGRGRGGHRWHRVGLPAGQVVVQHHPAQVAGEVAAEATTPGIGHVLGVLVEAVGHVDSRPQGARIGGRGHEVAAVGLGAVGVDGHLPPDVGPGRAAIAPKRLQQEALVLAVLGEVGVGPGFVVVGQVAGLEAGPMSNLSRSRQDAAASEGCGMVGLRDRAIDAGHVPGVVAGVLRRQSGQAPRGRPRSAGSMLQRIGLGEAPQCRPARRAHPRRRRRRPARRCGVRRRIQYWAANPARVPAEPPRAGVRRRAIW